MTSLISVPPRSHPVEFNAVIRKPHPIDLTALSTAVSILDVICRYRLRKRQATCTANVQIPSGFLSLIYKKVKSGSPIRLCLPAFPFKSPNTVDKVLGRLPDKAEEISLAHLNGLCAAVGNVYKPGAKLTIISDGLVYNDLLGVSDREVWAYGEALRAMAIEKGFMHLEFSRLQDLVHVDLPTKLAEITYVANATNFRCALLNTFGRADFNPSTEISENEDTCLTYRGYIKFLETDLRYVYPIEKGRSKSQFKTGTAYIAKQMLRRGDAFARAVRESFRDHLRLSIHPSSDVAKLSISPLPTSTAYTTPWHCAIAFDIDGTVKTGLRAEFDNNSEYELVYRDGRPDYYRKKSELFNWDSNITCEPLYPCGMMIRPALGKTALSMRDIEAAKVRALAEYNSPVILRGFAQTRDRELFVKKSEEFGTPLPWKFGLVLEVKDQGSSTGGLNNVLSSEWMPFHFDGLFKTKKRLLEDGSEKLLPNPPRFQLFTSVTPSPKDTGFTLFTPSRLVFEHLPENLPLSRLRDLTWTVSTSAFDATTMTEIPLIVQHPITGKPCLHYHEPWPQSKTAFQATSVAIDNVADSEGVSICRALDSLLHDRRNCYYHVWEMGDMVVSDNIMAMHTRSDFISGAERELWRIHFD